jgi:hypothetical protein
MLVIALLLAGGIAWWMHQRDELLPNLQRVLITGGIGILALRLFATGKFWLGLAAMIGGVIWWFLPARRLKLANNADLEVARALLGVEAGADAETIRAAHRQLITLVHPDHGGDAKLAGRVTAARDLLLAKLADS